MRLKASLGVLTGIAWLTSAAAVPRNEDVDHDTTCTSTTTVGGAVIITVPLSTQTAISASAFTVTVTSGDPGALGSPSGSSGPSAGATDAFGSGSSTCTSSETLFPGGQGTSGPVAPFTLTVTETEFPTGPRSTVTVPVVTVTVPSPSNGASGPLPTSGVPSGGISGGNSGVPLVTLTIPAGNGSPGSDITLTLPLTSLLPTSPSMSTVPRVSGAPAGSVVTVTIPEGPDSTATVVLTVTVPNGSPGSWSTIITAPAASGASSGPIVTVTLFTTEPSGLATPTPLPSVPSGASEPGSGFTPTCTTLTLGISVSGISSWIPVTIETVTALQPQPTQPVDISDGPSSGHSPSPLTVTYTVPLEGGMSAPFTGTLTITPMPPLPPSPHGPFGSIISGLTFTELPSQPTAVPPGPFGVSSSPVSGDVITYTVPQIGTTPAYTGIFTLQPGSPEETPSESSSSVQSGVETVTEPVTTISLLPGTTQEGESANPPLTATIPVATVSLQPSNGQGSGTSEAPELSPYPGQAISGANGQPMTVTVTATEVGASTQPSSGEGGSTGGGSNGQPSVFTLTVPIGGSTSSVITVTLPNQPSPGQSGPSQPGNGQQSTSTVTVPGGGISQTASGQSGVYTLTVIPSVSGQPSVFTVTLPEGTLSASSGSQPGVFTVTESITESVASPSAGTPVSGGSSGETPSVIAVTYTVPARSGINQSLYTVTYTMPSASATSTGPSEYGNSPGGPASNTTPGQSSPSDTIETITINQSGSSGPSAATGGSPVTITLSQTDASGSPIVVTLTPGGGVIPSGETSLVTSASTPAEETSPLTITLSQTNALGSPIIVTLTPTGGVVPSAPGYGSPNSANTVITVTPASGSPFVATIPLSDLTAATPGTGPRVSTSTVTVEPTPTVASLLTVTLSGSPVVVTIPAGTGVGGSPPSPSPYGIRETTGVASSFVTPGGSGSIVTAAQPLGSPLVVTIPLAGGSSIVVTVTPTGSPFVATIPLGGGSSTIPGEGTGSTPTVITVTPSSGSPFVVTIPLAGGSSTLPGGGSGPSPTVVTATQPSGSPLVVTIPLPGGSSTVVTIPLVGGLSTPSGGGSSPTPTVVTTTQPSGSPLVVTIPLVGGSSAVVTVTPSGSPFVATIPLGGSTSPAGGSEPVPTVVTVTPSSGSPFVVTIPLAGSLSAPTGVSQSAFTVTPSSGLPFVVTIPIAGSTSTTTGAGHSVLTVTPYSGSPFVVTIPLASGSSTPVVPTQSPAASLVTVTLASSSPVVLTIPLGGNSETSSTTQPGTGAGSGGSPLTPVGSLTGSLVTLTLPSGSPVVLTVPLGGGSQGISAPTVPAGYGGFTGSSEGPSRGPAQTLTVPESAITPAATGPETILVSDATLTETIPIGSGGSFTVIEVTTEVTLGTSLAGSSPTVSTISLTPTVVTYTLPGVYGQSASVLTFTTDVPVAPRSTAPGSLFTYTLTPVEPSTTAYYPSVITVWPHGFTSSPGVTPIIITISLGSNGESVIPGWPASTTFATSAVTPTTCTDDAEASGVDPNDGSGTTNVAASVITIWPVSSPSDTTCTTFSTVLSSLKSGSSDPHLTTATILPEGGAFTVITIPLESGSLVQPDSTSTCTDETSAAALSTIGIISFVSSIDASSSVILSAPVTPESSMAQTIPASPDTSADQTMPVSPETSTSATASQAASSDSSPPPQTEILDELSTRSESSIVVDAAVSPVVFISTGGAYGFPTASPYGNSASGYGSSHLSSSFTSMHVTRTTTIVESTVSVPIVTFATPQLSTSWSNLTSTAQVSSVSGPFDTAATSISSIGPITVSSASVNVTGSASATPVLNATSTAAAASSALASVACGAEGDRGETMFNFDDIPIVASNETDPALVKPQPVPSGYHHFQFSDGFHVVSPPSSPFWPSSGNQDVEYDVSFGPVAQISLAGLRTNPCFRFDFLGISLGCNSTDALCDWSFAGLQWNGTDEVVQAKYTTQNAGCVASENCTLAHMLLDSAAASQFTNLTAINITLTVGDQPQIWWADDLQVAWTDNTCSSSECRRTAPKPLLARTIPGNTGSMKGLLRRAVRSKASRNI